MKELIYKSVGASMLIALGNYALLRLGDPIGPVIFAFGLLGVCYMGLNLFTGKCGFLIEDEISVKDLLIMLIVNLVAGYVLGSCFAVCDKAIVHNALTKVASWNVSWAFFVKSILCGVIMYVAVYMYRKGTPLGILFGIPLFIFCGFQHCIANVVTLGVACQFHWSLLICILGNFLGSLGMWYISREVTVEDEIIIPKKKAGKK